jgi:hypothetical protein
MIPTPEISDMDLDLSFLSDFFAEKLNWSHSLFHSARYEFHNQCEEIERYMRWKQMREYRIISVRLIRPRGLVIRCLMTNGAWKVGS